MSYRYLYEVNAVAEGTVSIFVRESTVKVYVCTICGSLVTINEIDISPDIQITEWESGFDVHNAWHETITRIGRKADRGASWNQAIT